MKKIPSFLFLLTLLTACSAPTPAIPPTLPPVENTPLPTQALQFTPIPTLTFTPVPTEGFPTFVAPTSTPDPSTRPNTIQFPANGTYVDINDFIAINTSKTYTVNAMKGQIMSVSVLPQSADNNWTYIPLQIKGADGSVLCPQTESDCTAWRGVLPATQDYFITLSPATDVIQFMLRVAINPPGKSEQYFQYSNPANGVALTYSDYFAPVFPVFSNYKIVPELALYMNDQETYVKTNLSEAYFFLGSSADPQMVATCTDSNPNGGAIEQIVGNEVINSFTFVHSTSAGAGAGNLYEQEIYRMAYNNICYEVIYHMHSANIGNFPPDTVTEFDRNAIMNKMYTVFSTLTISK